MPELSVYELSILEALSQVSDQSETKGSRLRGALLESGVSRSDAAFSRTTKSLEKKGMIERKIISQRVEGKTVSEVYFKATNNTFFALNEAKRFFERFKWGGPTQ